MCLISPLVQCGGCILKAGYWTGATAAVQGRNASPLNEGGTDGSGEQRSGPGCTWEVKQIGFDNGMGGGNEVKGGTEGDS